MKESLRTQVTDTMTEMAMVEGFSYIRSWYDADRCRFNLQASISEERLQETLDGLRRLPQVPVSELARRIVAAQVGKGLRRYGRKRR